jgi:hypothetical protein
VDERYVRPFCERLDDLLGLVLPQKTVIHEHAHQVVADGPVDEHSSGR